jgi:CRISPR-associated protein Csd1
VGVNDQPEGRVRMVLDVMNSTRGYLLGRLFSIVERVEETQIGKTTNMIYGDFYDIAANSPSTVFPQLMRLKDKYLTTLQSREQAVDFEEQIAQIISRFEGFPEQLSPQDQARFAFGYYHQRQQFLNKHGLLSMR